jgi:hypothetical protein
MLVFTACLNYEQDVNLHPDGSGRMKIEYWMKFPDTERRDLTDNLGIFNPDSIRNEFTSSHSKVENVEVYVDSIDTTTHAIVEFSFDRIDSLNNTKMFADSKFRFNEETSGQIVFSQNISPIATGFGIDADNFKVTYRYTLTGTIISNNAHQVEDNTLTWNYSLADIGTGKSINVTFKPFKLEKTPDWIYMLSGTVLVLVIFFLFRRKRG